MGPTLPPATAARELTPPGASLILVIGRTTWATGRSTTLGRSDRETAVSHAEGPPLVKIFEKLMRAGEGRTLKRLDDISAQVNALEDDFEKLTDAELRGETDVFKHAAGRRRDPRRPAARGLRGRAGGGKRTLGKRHFDVQIMGGRPCTRATSPR